MAFDLDMLTGLGIAPDKAERLIALHNETVTALSAQVEEARQEYEEAKAQAEEAQRLEAELNEYGGKNYKAMYEAEKAAFDTLKAEQEAKETEARKREAYKGLLREAGIKWKVAESISRISDVSSYRLDEAGNLDNPEAIRADIRQEWNEFIPAKGKGGYWNG